VLNRRFSYLSEQVRLFDRDRYATLLFTPYRERKKLLILYSFNVEISRIWETVSEPSLGHLRLQWWYDIFRKLQNNSNIQTGHPVADSFNDIIKNNNLSFDMIFNLIDSKRADIDQEEINSLNDLLNYSENSSSILSLLALEILGVDDELTIKAAKDIGIAWALTGIIRSTVPLSQVGRVLIPNNFLSLYELSGSELMLPEKSKQIGMILKKIGYIANSYLNQVKDLKHKIDTRAIPVLLISTIADYYLKVLYQSNYNLFDRKVINLNPNISNILWNSIFRKF